jgi:hypothetical protein
MRHSRTFRVSSPAVIDGSVGTLQNGENSERKPFLPVSSGRGCFPGGGGRDGHVTEMNGNDGRKHGRGVCLVWIYGGRRNLSDNALLADGRTRRRMGGQGEEKLLRPSREGHGDAVRGRGGRRGPRGAPGGRLRDDLHGLAGTAAHDPEHVPDRRRAPPGRLSREREDACQQRVEHLRRASGRHGDAADRLRHVRVGQRPGRHELCGRRAPRRDRRAGSVPSLLRWLPDFARDPEDRGSRRGRTPLPDRLERRQSLPRRIAEPRPSRPPGHDGQSGRLFPAPRGSQSALSRSSRRNRPAPRRNQPSHRTGLRILRLFRRAGRRQGRRRDGVGLQHDPGDRRLSERPRRTRRARLRARLPAVFAGTPPGGLPGNRGEDRGPRPDQGKRGCRRTALRRGPKRVLRGGIRAGDRRGALRARIQRVHAVDGGCRLREPEVGPAEELVHGRHRRRRVRNVAPDASGTRGNGARGDGLVHVLGARVGRHGRCEQEHDPDHRRQHGHVRAGILRLRFEEVGRRHDLPPQVRREADRVGPDEGTGTPGGARRFPRGDSADGPSASRFPLSTVQGAAAASTPVPLRRPRLR